MYRVFGLLLLTVFNSASLATPIRYQLNFNATGQIGDVVFSDAAIEFDLLSQSEFTRPFSSSNPSTGFQNLIVGQPGLPGLYSSIVEIEGFGTADISDSVLLFINLSFSALGIRTTRFEEPTFFFMSNIDASELNPYDLQSNKVLTSDLTSAFGDLSYFATDAGDLRVFSVSPGEAVFRATLIPLPGAGVLFVSALGGLGLWRRRQLGGSDHNPTERWQPV